MQYRKLVALTHADYIGGMFVLTHWLKVRKEAGVT